MRRGGVGSVAQNAPVTVRLQKSEVCHFLKRRLPSTDPSREINAERGS